MRVTRIYHAAGESTDRQRERALVTRGLDVTLIVPRGWPGGEAGPWATTEPFSVRELDALRVGDVNRHRYRDPSELAEAIASSAPDVVDIHEEPVSAVTRQVLQVVLAHTPVCVYTAQNLDKRFPPPFSRWERRALARADALYPCSRQAASVARGKGFEGLVSVLSLGVDTTLFRPGGQSLTDPEVTLLLVGRLVPEKGVLDAVDALAAVRQTRSARLLLVGNGPTAGVALNRAREMGVDDHVQVRPWAGPEELAALYGSAHVVLVPSRSTPRWVEQFGRVIVEAQSAGAVVVGYASGSIPEVAGNSAVLVPEGDAEALGRAASRVVSDPEQWHRLRAAGIARALDHSWDRVAAGMVDMYEHVLERRHRNRRIPVATSVTRAAARAEFGPTATAAGQTRPFALPLLRDHPRLGSLLGAGIDMLAETRARLAQ